MDLENVQNYAYANNSFSAPYSPEYFFPEKRERHLCLYICVCTGCHRDDANVFYCFNTIAMQKIANKKALKSYENCIDPILVTMRSKFQT